MSTNRIFQDNAVEPKRIRHDTILLASQALGLKTDLNGTCAGLATLAMQAFFVGEIDVFNKRLKLIDAIMRKGNGKLLVEQINLAKQRFKNNDPQEETSHELMSKEEALELLEINAFLQNVYLAQNPTRFKELYPEEKKPTSQVTSHESVSLIASQKLEPTTEKLSLTEILTLDSMFSQDELSKLLATIKKKICTKEETITTPVGIMLSRPGHRMFLGLDTKNKQWLFFDANSMPPVICKKSSTAAKKIIKGFSSKKNGHATFSAQALAFTDPTNNPFINAVKSIKSEESYTTTQAITTQKALQTDSKGNTWLMTAAKEGDEKKVKTLLEKGADVTARNDKDTTALDYAIARKHFAIAETLIKSGAPVNYPDVSKSPLFLAIKTNNHRLAEILLDNGADPNASKETNPSQDTPLFAAIRKRDHDMVKLLLNYNADPFKTHKNNRPIALAKFLQLNDISTTIEHAETASTSPSSRKLFK